MIEKYKITIDTYDGSYREMITREDLSHSGGDIMFHIRTIGNNGYTTRSNNGDILFYPPHSIKKIILEK